MNHSIKKIFLVFKRSIFQKYIQTGRHPRLTLLHRKKHPLAKRLYDEHAVHSHTIEKIREELKGHAIRFKSTTARAIPPLGRYDLIITVGGDGTFLRASHHVTKQPLLGVNSSPKVSVGALCSATLREFPKKLRAILNNRFRTRSLNRLEIRVNGKKLRHMAINDVLFCNTSPGGTSRYLIDVGNRREEQRSSGVWISTAAGSTAAIHASGGKKLPHFSKQIQYLVREPYQGRHAPYRIVKGILPPGREIKFVNQMLHAALYIDGLQAIHPLHFGDRVTIQNSPLPLAVVV
ncbi:MAG: NAD(+)/NADH kinase [Deltaproteobacteria bacterium]|nr:NAD(+)/NADH kinase [Deltaproteobacteria bacterium]